jgi:hypothetical protein
MVRFEAIVTLNQDFLLERQYLNDNVTLSLNSRGLGWKMPGLDRVPEPPRRSTEQSTGEWVPAVLNEGPLSGRYQPYIKLHGSSNWIDGDAGSR